MSWGADLLVILSDYPAGYRLMRRRIAGIPGPGRRREVSDGTLRVTLSRLKQKGLVENKDGLWKITGLGRKTCSKDKSKARPRKGEAKNLIISFDIPETKHSLRDKLRSDLMALGFVMLQKSLWFGPGPLPEEFLEELDHARILKCLKFFEAREADIVGAEK